MFWRRREQATTSETADQLAEEIAATLRGLISVSPVGSGSLLSRPEFWRRCRLITPDWQARSITSRIYVDGFIGACYWNSWKVYTSQLESGLSLWLGFAFRSGRWTQHAWCMLGDRIVESTAPFLAYYGAELNVEECECFGNFATMSDPAQKKNLYVATIVDKHRDYVPYDAAIYANSIGRERDPITREVKDGLGR